MPADDAGGNFIADAVGKNGGMFRAALCGARDRRARVALCGCAFQEARVFGPGHVEEDAHAQLIRQVKKPSGGQMVGANRVDADRLHQSEILRHALRRWKLLAPRVRRERAVRHAFDAQFLTAAREVLACHAQTRWYDPSFPRLHSCAVRQELSAHYRLLHADSLLPTHDWRAPHLNAVRFP